MAKLNKTHSKNESDLSSDYHRQIINYINPNGPIYKIHASIKTTTHPILKGSAVELREVNIYKWPKYNFSGRLLYANNKKGESIFYIFSTGPSRTIDRETQSNHFVKDARIHGIPQDLVKRIFNFLKENSSEIEPKLII